MKTASMVLGIVGGALAIAVAIMLIFLNTAMLTSFSGFEYDDTYSSGFATHMFDTLGTIYTVMGICAIIGGIAGIIGGIIVKNNNTAGGVLMIVGTVLCGLNIVLLVGSIFAFIRDKQPAPPYAPYPPYPPYPVQGPYMNQPPYPPYPPVYPNQYPQQQPQYQPPKNPADDGQ